MLKNQFQRKYMHPTRRKLVDMVHTGQYNSNLTMGYTPLEDKSLKQVGDRWTDSSGTEWEQRHGYKVKVNKLTEMMSEVRNELYKKSKCKKYSDDCDLRGKPSYTNKILIEKTGYCSGCLSKLEHPIRVDGLYTVYENFKVMTNMIKEGVRITHELKQAYDEVKQEYEYMDSDGKSQKWVMEKNVDEVKQDILDDLSKIEEELKVVIGKRKELYEILEPKNYELVNNITETETK